MTPPSLVDAVPAFGVLAVETVAVGVVAGNGGVRRALACAIATLGLLIPFLVPADQTLLRFIVVLGTIVPFLRAIDLARDPRTWPLATRLWLVVAIFDVRQVVRVAPRVRTREIGIALFHFALAAAGFWVALVMATSLEAPLSLVVRWVAGAIAMYGAADFAGRAVTELHAVRGMRIPVQHRTPILAESAGAFWSRHWNLNVSDWLARHFHRPLARAGHPLLGLVLAFVASTLLHAWIALVPLEFTAGASMGGYFLVQGLVVAAEPLLRVARWPRAFRHAWTIAVVAGPSPLFIEPLLRIAEGR